MGDKIPDVEMCGKDCLQRGEQGLVRPPETSNSPPDGGIGEKLTPEPSENGDCQGGPRVGVTAVEGAGG